MSVKVALRKKKDYTDVTCYTDALFLKRKKFKEMRTELLSLIAKKMNVNGLSTALLLTALLMFGGVSWGQTVIISEVADPDDHWEGRFVELYNATNSSVDLSAGNWYLAKQSNGGTITSFALTGSIASGDTYVLGSTDANFNGQYGFNPDQSDGNISSNGDDGYFLYSGGDHNSGTLIDAYGVIDEDGTGKPWEFLDALAVRNTSVCSANTTWAASEWTITDPADVVDADPGNHTCDCPASGPTITTSVSSITGLDYEVGNGPSTPQTFVLSGTDLDGTQTVVTPPTNFEISIDGGTNYFTTARTVLHTAFDQTIYVRLVSGLSINTYSGNITCVDNGTASSVNVAVSGEVTAPDPCAIAKTIPYTQNFDSDDCWTITGSWEIGSLSGGADAPSTGHSGNTVAGTDFNANYADNLDIYLTSPVFDLVGSTAPFLSFWMDLESESYWDGGTVQISVNSGSWITIDQNDTGYGGATPNDSDVDGLADNEHGWSGRLPSSGEWTEVTIDLFNLSTTGLNSISASDEIEVRFWFGSDGSIGANGWFIDDFSITEAPDTDTEAYDSGSQPAASDISSTSTAFTNVFQIEIEDMGTSDGLVTDVTNIRIKPHSTNTADWTDHIADVKLNNGSDITIGSPTITDTYIDIPISAGNLQIADGGSDVITLQVQIINTGITDNAVLSFVVDADDHGFTADNSGSDFASEFLLGDFNSNDFTIDVTGDEIRIAQQPTDVIINTTMSPSVTVAFTDANGNIDTDFAGAGYAIGLSTTGSFDASATTEVDAVNGVATFDNLVFDAEATDITLTTTDPDGWGWTNVTSYQFDVTPVPVAPSIYISEIASKGHNASFSDEYIEISNNGGSDTDMTGWTLEYYNSDDEIEGGAVSLSGTLSAGDAWVIAARSGSSLSPDFTGNFPMNSSCYVKLRDNGVIVNEVGTASSDEFGDDINYEFTACGTDNLAVSSWDNLGTGNGTPGLVNCAVTDPTLLSTESSLSSFTYILGNGPSAVQSFDLSGLNLDGSDVTVTPPANFEISQTSGSGFQNSAITLSAYDGTSTTIYVRLKSGLFVNTYGPENITISGGGATDIDIACNGEVSLSQVTDLAINCITNTTAEILWTAPAGTYDGVIIAVRNGSDPVDDISADPSTVSSDAVFGDGYEYGAASPYSYVVYKGAGNTVTVTGLTAGEDYQIKAFVFSGTLYGDAVSTFVSNLRVRDVTAASATAGNTTAEIAWTNITNCFDEIMVVGHETSPVSSLPTGDGSSYLASSVYGSGTDIGTSEFVVYQGTGFNVNLSNLTNGVTYYFTIFVREGNEWSVGVVVSVTPSSTTFFNPGELIIVGFDATTQSSATDKIYLATFVDVLPNTSFLYVNSRFEAGAAANVRTNEWHGGSTDPDEDPGIVTITYTGASTISAGSIISFDIAFAEANNFEIDGVSTTDFSSSFNGSSANISGGSGDQLWLLQGSFTDQGTYHTLDGNVLYGMTSREAWVDFSSSVDGSNSDTQRESRLHPDVECFNFELSTTQAYAYYKNGTSGTPGDPAHDANMRTLLLDVMDPLNWETGNGGGTLDIAEDFSACDVAVIENAIGRRFCVSAYSADHQWKGDIDTDWFNCANWQSLHIPNEENDVLFDSDDCYNNIELTAGDTAKCKNFTIQGAGAYDIIAAADNTKYLEVFGNVNINTGSTIVFDDSDSGTNDGTLLLHGNWNNTVGVNGFVEGNSTVKFVGVDNQTISSNSTTETFCNFIVNKPSGAIIMNNDIECDYLDLTSGLVNTSTNLLHVLNTDPSNIVNHTSTSYVNGSIRRNVNVSGVYDFPVGDNSNYELATVDILSSTALTYLDAHFALSDLGDLDISSLNLIVDGTPLVSVLDAGYWQIEPNTGASVNYDIEVNLAGASNAAANAEQHAVIKRDDAISDWELQGSHNNATQSIASGVVTAKVSSLSAFSQFAIARSQANVLAVELIDFSVKCETAGLSVNWTTASEDNADYFMIQYSSDTRNWETLQKLPAFGTTHITQEYQILIEDSPRKGYYRLAEVDMDGTVTLYAPDYVNCLDADEQAMITVSPNPATDFARLSAEKTISNLYLVAIYDATGKLVNMLTWENPAEQQLKLDITGFAPGYYQLKIYNEREFYNLKLLVK
jgi:hypothetical protein